MLAVVAITLSGMLFSDGIKCFFVKKFIDIWLRLSKALSRLSLITPDTKFKGWSDGLSLSKGSMNIPSTIWVVLFTVL